MEYQAKIEVDMANIGFVTTLEEIEADEENLQELKSLIDYQIQFLMGSFASESFKKQTKDATATISKDYKIYLQQVTLSNLNTDHLIIDYKFEGKVLVHRDFFGPAGRLSKGSIPVTLPLNPDTIYQMGLRNIRVPINHDDPNSERDWEMFNLCTDDHYNSEDDFFYFWDPDRINRRGRTWRYANCPLRGDKQNVIRTKGKLTRLKNSYQKYFEYDRLYSKKKLKVSVFLGYLDDVKEYSSPNLKDPVLDGMHEIVEYLKENDFIVTTKKEYKRYSSKRGFYGKGPNVYMTFIKKKIARDVVKKGEHNPTIDVEIELLLADTAIQGVDKAFHDHYRKALRYSDIVIYDGHSGLGANLDLELIKARLAPANKYQIIYLNGCSGYPYFKDMYFDAKQGGSKNVDLILSGISTLSDTIGGNLISFMEGFLQGKTLNTSYILQKVEAANFDINGSYLTGILGEEDNEWSKQ